ncbi:hypothetical protein HHI36_015590 [Cryptolaemus montrouzieri]|uniref:Zinc finger PHD-type domain-containing protein n=1 Tax=Cryptolaemus montrouzieri TaxID=559131 RepID=A0ABD2N625_9CUCU
MSSVCERCKGVCDMDRALVCDSCCSMFHEKCSGFAGSEKRVMFCSECRLAIKKVPLILRRFDDLEREVRKLEEELVMLRQSNESEIETLKNSMKNVPEIDGDPEELIAEINERNSEVNNIMVYKLNESNSQSLNERILHDKAEVVKILDIIDIREDVIEKVIRVGKKGTIPKPMKIFLSNSGIARTVLRNKSKKMERYGRDISVGPNQTIMQKTHLKRVLGKLEQREKDGQEDLHVKFVWGIPTIMKKN